MINHTQLYIALRQIDDSADRLEVWLDRLVLVWYWAFAAAAIGFCLWLGLSCYA